MTPPEMTRASTVLVLPVPDDRPPVLSADEAFCCPATGFVQDRLALDFDDTSDEVFELDSRPRLENRGAYGEGHVRPGAEASARRWRTPR